MVKMNVGGECRRTVPLGGRNCLGPSPGSGLTHLDTNSLAGGQWKRKLSPMSASAHVLVVDDHPQIRDALARYLERHEIRGTSVGSAAAARQALRTAAVDLVVLDIMMPGEDGLQLCRHLRETTRIPVILLTAMADETDRIIGLEVWADDYVTKPFNPRELLARVRAVIRRARSLPPEREAVSGRIWRFVRWKLDTDRRELVDEEGILSPLSTGEFRLLVALLERPGTVLSCEQLLDLPRGAERHAIRPRHRQPGQPLTPEDRT